MGKKFERSVTQEKNFSTEKRKGQNKASRVPDVSVGNLHCLRRSMPRIDSRCAVGPPVGSPSWGLRGGKTEKSHRCLISEGRSCVTLLPALEGAQMPAWRTDSWGDRSTPEIHVSWIMGSGPEFTQARSAEASQAPGLKAWLWNTRLVPVTSAAQLQKIQGGLPSQAGGRPAR